MEEDFKPGTKIRVIRTTARLSVMKLTGPTDMETTKMTDHPPTYDEYTVYVPHDEIVKEISKALERPAPTLDEILVAGYTALGYEVDGAWIETDWRDTHSI